MDHWPVNIYAVSDDHAQELIVGLLRGVGNLTVESVTDGSHRFVVAACGDRRQAHLVRRMITAIDFEATLVRGGVGSADALSV